jgi:hypothetical protein
VLFFVFFKSLEFPPYLRGGWGTHISPKQELCYQRLWKAGLRELVGEVINFYSSFADIKARAASANRRNRKENVPMKSAICLAALVILILVASCTFSSTQGDATAATSKSMGLFGTR